MITRKLTLRTRLPLPRLLARTSCPDVRHAHGQTSLAQSPVPDPTPFVPDLNTFLSLIGRDLSKQASKIPDWQSLFTLSSAQLRELGVEPPRARRYLIWWRERFRHGIFGIGGDLKHVKDGEAQIRVVEAPVSHQASDKPPGKDTSTAPRAGLRKVCRMIVDEPADIIRKGATAEQLRSIMGMKIVGTRTIVGPFIKTVKGTSGSVVKIKRQAGMWEIKRGVKLDGGERRRKMVRRQRLLEERRTSRG